MTQNFLQLQFRNQVGTLIDTVTFTTDEIPAGITRNVPFRINSFVTVEGKGRAFPQQDGTRFEFTVVLAANITLRKLDSLATNSALGYTVDATALIGAMNYNAVTENLEYNAGQATITNGLIMEFTPNYRQMVGSGQRSRVEVPIVIREGGATALPLAINYVGN
jgi:hypothetical protein